MERFKIKTKAKMKNIIKFIFVISFIFNQSVFAFEKDAENFIIKTTSDAKNIILNKSLDQKVKRKKLEDLALKVVDTEGLAKYTLGEERKKITEKQLAEYINIFKIFFSKNLSSKLNDYSDQEVSISGSKKISENYVLVSSKIISKKDKQEIIVDWRIFLVNNKLVIRDLVVEGLSLARTQKEEFASIIANKGFDGLIQNLKDFNSKN